MTTVRIRRGIGALVFVLTAGVMAACAADNPTAPNNSDDGPCYPVGGQMICDED